MLTQPKSRNAKPLPFVGHMFGDPRPTACPAVVAGGFPARFIPGSSIESDGEV